jgi:hypothetical protein
MTNLIFEAIKKFWIRLAIIVILHLVLVKTIICLFDIEMMILLFIIISMVSSFFITKYLYLK